MIPQEQQPSNPSSYRIHRQAVSTFQHSQQQQQQQQPYHQGKVPCFKSLKILMIPPPAVWSAYMNLLSHNDRKVNF